MDFKEHFEIIYNKFIRHALKNGAEQPSKLALGRFLDIGPGRIQAWEKGQWPSAADLATIERKLGFSLRWLVTGEGSPERDTETEAASCAQTQSYEGDADSDGNFTAMKLQISELQTTNIELVNSLKEVLRELKDVQSESIGWQREYLTLQRQFLQTPGVAHAAATGTPARGAPMDTPDNK